MIKVGDILIAKPFLQDGHFKRSVVYLCEHNNEGSLGFVINKSHGLLLCDIFPDLKNGNFPLFDGGPVSPNQLFYTHTLGARLPDSQHIVDNVYWGGNFFKLSEMIEKGVVSMEEIRFYVGYSGWGAEQLSTEITNDMWFAKQSNYNKLMLADPDKLWGEELLKINPRYKAFADFSFDPSLN
ncbi:MAG: YqgE/AlgH family protein [Burkholderiales bacterium]|nr:YqgE/AlgH family protein [Bacteroidia bacterium]